jgi:PPOX class probable F420-dependent enzyme
MTDDAKRDAFLTATHFCILATLRRDGRARLSPMAYAYDDGKILITTMKTRFGAITAHRDPRVTVCCFNPDQRRSYVNVSGRAEIVEDEGVFLHLMRLVRGRDYTEEELAEQKQRFVDEGRVVLRITPEDFVVHIV